MPRKLPIKAVLEELGKEDLVDFARRQELATSGTKLDLVDRLAAHHGRDLVDLMRHGTWTLKGWNEFADEAFGLPPRKTYEELADDLLGRATPDGKRRSTFIMDYGGWSVAEVRDDDKLLAEIARHVGMSARELIGVLDGVHGRTLLASLEDEIFQSDPSTRGQTLATRSSTLGAASVVGTSAPNESSVDDSAPPPIVPLGTLLAGRYRVRAKLGEGGFGAAYEVATERPQGIFVAKVPGKSSHAVRSIYNEAEKLKLLGHHPGLCRVFGCEEDARFGPFLLVEHGGRSLKDTYVQPVAFEQVVAIIAQAADALKFLHDNGVVHGDVNPGNVLVASGRVRLVDFGLASFLVTAPASAGVTRIGTQHRGYHAHFSATEVLQGRPPNARSDQSSLALVAQWLLCGDHAFSAGARDAIANTPAAAREAFARALNYEPSARFPTCPAFVEGLAGATG